MGGQAWVAYGYDGEPLEPEHGGPAASSSPPLLLEERQVGRGLRLSVDDEPGFWESVGYHNYGDPWREQRYWATEPVRVAASATVAETSRDADGDAAPRRADWPGHGPDSTSTSASPPRTATGPAQLSIASRPSAERLELTVVRIDDGEVSPYSDERRSTVGDQLELRGPVGGWFVWEGTDPTAGAAGGRRFRCRPLMAMLRHHAASQTTARCSSLYSARAPERGQSTAMSWRRWPTALGGTSPSP
jgi:hypothetical protein